MFRSSVFHPVKDYRFTSEECKATDTEATAHVITVTIQQPRHTYGFQEQFKHTFAQGELSGVRPQLLEDKQGNASIVVTMKIGKILSVDTDKVFRATISQLDQLSLRDQDALRIEYEKWLDEKGYVSTLIKAPAHKGHEHYHNSPSMAH